MTDDAALMRLVAGGDADALRRLFDRHGNAVFNFFLRSTGSREDAEDLTQQTFVNLYRAAGRYRPTAAFRTWLFRIARNLAVSYSRRRPAGDSLDLLAEGGFEPPAAGVDPAADASHAELRGAYARALLQLPEEQRTAVELRIGRGLSYREIAEAMGKSLPAVEALVYRARERLAAALARFREDAT
ncbi:MAG: sigma-70 family RNA polymerase sigma factor [Candidatus Krumholzibacteriota bacterium]|nr:sigma-70 family RNA polymerase sigma factor [Candidatus Krumholzibacteriota bacterium]